MRQNENIKEFKNGNINIKFNKDTLEDLKAGHVSIIEVLSYTLDSLDCYLIGEEFCLSNYDTGVLVYNAYSDKCYILSFGDVYNKLSEGQTIKLFSFDPTEDERQKINEWGC